MSQPSNQDSIHMGAQRIRESFLQVPREPASDPKYIKHVYCDGARFHVLSYHSFGIRCSEKNCIYNKQP